MKRVLIAVSLAVAPVVPVALAAPAFATEANPPLGSTLNQGLSQSNDVLVGEKSGVVQQVASSAVETLHDAVN
ncbi:hypothetical protein ABZ953_34410 [Streptomyces sp. NPDC046465]|uniref:hypothetical protein n=1 Tax=Streptomyces sp. NPDC046465 TaxID=3155810 RepID=UPI0034090B93